MPKAVVNIYYFLKLSHNKLSFVCLAVLPDTIKKEMLARLRQYLSKHEELQVTRFFVHVIYLKVNN